MASQLNSGRLAARSPLAVLLTAALSWWWCTPAALAANESPSSAPQASAAPSDALPPGARKLARRLQLTGAQQAELAKILTSQREQVRKLWSDPELEPAYRVRAMRAINDQTEDKIRGLLTDEQKKKYITPHSFGTTASPRSPAVEHWFDAPPRN